MTQIVIPYKPRAQFVGFHNLVPDKKRFAVLVCHRRMGKTVACVNHLIRDCIRNPGVYAYIGPTYKQTERIAWKYFHKFTEPIPQMKLNEAKLMATFPNGAMCYLLGSEQPDSLRGMGLYGAVLDEYQLHPPSLFGEVIAPCLADHHGYAIFAGTIIAAALETGINTDLPGDVLATVAENIYDSVSGKNLLIPQGSKLLAKYSSNISFGQNRVQVAWQRLIRPDGVSVQLANMNGVDPQGMSGYSGYVDQHWWEYAKGIGLMALFSIIDGQLQYSIKTADNQGVSDIANSVTAGIDQIGTQFTSNAMNIQPTIIVKQGAKVQVFVNSDIIMPPANQKTVPKKYSLQVKEGGRE